MLVDRAQALGIFGVSRTHFMAQAVGVSDVGGSHASTLMAGRFPVEELAAAARGRTDPRSGRAPVPARTRHRSSGSLSASNGRVPGPRSRAHRFPASGLARDPGASTSCARRSSPPPSKRRSIISSGMFTPSASLTASSRASWSCTAPQRGIAHDRVDGRAGQCADGIEADVAPELEPDVPADIVADRRLEPGCRQRGAKRSMRAERSPSGSPMMKRLNS